MHWLGSGWRLQEIVKSASPILLLELYPLVCDVRRGKNLRHERRLEDGRVTASRFCISLALESEGRKDKRPFALENVVLSLKDGF